METPAKWACKVFREAVVFRDSEARRVRLATPALMALPEKTVKMVSPVLPANRAREVLL